MEDMLFYQASDSESYSSGFREGARKALYKVKGNVELYLEREESYKWQAMLLKLGKDKAKAAEVKAEAFREILSVIKELEETLSCL